MHLVATANGQRAYRNKNNNNVFVYAVEGTPEEIADYKTVKAQYLVIEENTGRPLFYSLSNIPLKTRLVKNRKGDNFYAEVELLETAIEEKVKTLKSLASFTGFSKAQIIEAALNGSVSSASPSRDEAEEIAPAVVVTPPAVVDEPVVQ